MEKMYYYRNGDQQIGPVSLDQMRGAVTPDTYVWAEGMANWQTVSQVPELMSQLGLAVQSQPQPQPQMQSSTPSYQQPQYNTNEGGSMPPKPDNHMVLSIITIFICQPLGIIALVMSLQSDSAYKSGNYDGAVKKAQTAKTLSLVGIIGSVVFIVLYILMFVVAAGAGALQSY
ncbi:MAG: CD225/dispanin family protein [Bacteroidales bacterium]|nr:CD225/dispanin family protein [Bacteroidales bacterium]